MRKLTKKALSIVLCLMLIVSMFSGAINITAETGDTTTLPGDYDYATTVVGTGKDGKTDTVTGFGASDVNVGLANADFSEGFNDWAIFRRWDTVADTASLSGIATVENGLVTIKGRSYHDDGTTAFDSEGLGLVSQPFTIPGLAAGDKLILTIAAGRGTKIRGAIGEYNRADNNGVYALTKEGENNLGKSTPNYPYDLWVTSELTVTDPSAYFVVTIRNKDITKDVSFKDVRIYKVTSDKNLIDVTNGCTQDSATVNANGGTAENGMLVARDVNNTYYATDLVTTSLMNGNFNDGLKYWRMAFLNVSSGANAGRRGFPSYYTEIVDGAAVITGWYDQNQASQSGIRTPDLNLDAHVGKNLSFSLNVVKVASGGGVRVRILKNGTQIYRSSTVYATGTFTTDEVTIEEGARYALEIGCNNDASKNGKTYITIDDVTLNIPGLEPDVPAGPPAYYGTEADGFNSTGSSYPMALKPVDEFVNLDFQQGFIYWSGKKYKDANNPGSLASDSLKIVTEGENKYVTLKDEGYVDTMRSVLMKAEGVSVGDKLVVIYDAKGNDATKLRVTLSQDHLRGADQGVVYDEKTGLNKGGNASPGATNVLVNASATLKAIPLKAAEGWTTYLTGYTNAIDDPTTKSSTRPCLPDIFLQVIVEKAAGVNVGDQLDVAIDNIRIAKVVNGVYTDVATGETIFNANEAAVATVDGENFFDLPSALAAAKNGGTLVLKKNIELTAPIVIANGEDVTIDLNGKTLTYNSTVQGEAMITNNGTLTINDTADTGVINYNYTGAADPSYRKGNYTISNGGTLTVNGGKITIANLSQHAKYPIDNNSTTGDAILVINGGHLYNYNTSAIRQFCNSTTNQNSVTINGGVIEGYCAIWVQNPGSKTVNGNLSIAGGEIKSTAKAYVDGTANLEDVGSAIYFTIAEEGGAWSETSAMTVTGGIFNENLYLAEEAPANLTVEEENATFNGYVELPAPPVVEEYDLETELYYVKGFKPTDSEETRYGFLVTIGIDSLDYKANGCGFDLTIGEATKRFLIKGVVWESLTVEIAGQENPDVLTPADFGENCNYIMNYVVYFTEDEVAALGDMEVSVKGFVTTFEGVELTTRTFNCGTLA